MKSLIVLAVVLSIALCGFQIPGNYEATGECNAYRCQSVKTAEGQPFTCPFFGKNHAKITYESGTYTLNMQIYSPNVPVQQMVQTFDSSNFVADPYTGDQQIQIPMSDNHVLNLQPCYKGRSTSTFCPSDPIQASKTLVGWKSFNGQPLENCSFQLIRE